MTERIPVAYTPFKFDGILGLGSGAKSTYNMQLTKTDTGSVEIDVYQVPTRYIFVISETWVNTKAAGTCYLKVTDSANNELMIINQSSTIDAPSEVIHIGGLTLNEGQKIRMLNGGAAMDSDILVTGNLIPV